MNQPIVLKTGWARTSRGKKGQRNVQNERIWEGTDKVACGYEELGRRNKGREAESFDFFPVLSRGPLTQLSSGFT